VTNATTATGIRPRSRKQRPQRRATDRISIKRLTLMAIVVIGASVPHWSMLPLWIPALLLASIAWRIAARRVQLPLPNRAARIALALTAFGAILLEYRTINGLTAGSALLVVMVSLKYLESHTQRDQLVLMLISYFLVFAGLLYQDSALSGIYLIVFVWMTTVGLMQLGRRGDLLHTRVTAGVSGRYLLQAVPIMLVLFVLFPRLPGPLWSGANNAAAGTTGLSDSMAPGDITNLGLSDVIAFRVEFPDGAPAAQDLYWRGPVLSVFDGRTWTRRAGMWGDVSDSLSFAGDPVRYSVSLEPGGRRWAFALEMPAQWSTMRRRNLAMRSDYQLVAFGAETINGRLNYEVTSYTDFLANERLNEAQRDVYLRLPDGFNPRTQALMQTLQSESNSPEALIARTLEEFSTGEYFYTLTPQALGRDTIDDFVFETKEGFCEHYASAFTVMMRFAGIPARVVTGYQGGELNPYAEYYIVRESNAHAWSEVWLEDRGWVRVDPVAAVAPERISLGLGEDPSSANANGVAALANLGWARQLSLAWDAVDTVWNEWIIGYGPALQRSLIEWLGLGRLRWTEMLTLSISGALAIVFSTALALAWRARSRERVDLAARLFAAFVKRARRAGVPERASTEPPAAYETRACARLPAYAEEIRAIVHCYLQARYEHDPQGHHLAKLSAHVRAFRPRAARV
jgi:transglutaminase-like putative cysteine protease